MSNKNLFVIGGPNGAGKSTSSQAILNNYNLVAFDWDKLFDQSWSNFNYDPSVIEGIRTTTNTSFSEYIESSLEGELDIAFETNFHTPFSFEICNRAKERGYKTNLIFLMVQSIDVCFERVDQRVKNGGHYVSKKEIIERYHKGLENLDTSPGDFDNIILLDTTEPYTIKNVANIQNGKVTKTYMKISDSMKNHMPKLIAILNG